ncbi:hypothetical protein, partial [Cereibacter johrii]|uniref:hypothetical protein n=1 Tax=Cereibacter johrii TaxID=445629 RepID=UPI003CE6EF39
AYPFIIINVKEHRRQNKPRRQSTSDPVRLIFNCRGRRFCHPLPRLRPALPVFVSVKRFLGADGPGRKRIF